MTRTPGIDPRLAGTAVNEAVCTYAGRVDAHIARIRLGRSRMTSAYVRTSRGRTTMTIHRGLLDATQEHQHQVAGHEVSYIHLGHTLANAAGDQDPTTGRARLSYRRAEELWVRASEGLTLHQLRHSALTHLAEDGVDTGMLKANSRHASMRSVERYVNPSDTAVRDLTNRYDPEARRRR